MRREILQLREEKAEQQRLLKAERSQLRREKAEAERKVQEAQQQEEEQEGMRREMSELRRGKAEAEFKAQSAEKRNSPQCCVCWVEPAIYLTVPCGHQCLCSTCKALVEGDGKQECPMCCQTFQTIVQVFTA